MLSLHMIAPQVFLYNLWLECHGMPVLPLQIRLDERHVAGIDSFCTVQDPRTGLHVTLSRQQVILMMIDDFMTRHAQPPPLPSPLLGEQEQHLKPPAPASLPM